MLSLTKIVLGLVLGILGAVSVCADTVKPVAGTMQSQSLKKVIRKTVTLKYMIYLPEDYGKESRKHWPLMLYLHGRGVPWNDTGKVGMGVPSVIIDQCKKYGVIMVAPHCGEESWWPDETDLLIGLLNDMESRYKIDKKREYVMGLSMGGYGTWALAIQQPKRFAAIAPICGGADPKYAPVVKDISMWVFHGEKDSVVPFSQSKNMVDAIKAAGGNPKFTAYPDLDHNSWSATWDNPEFWAWLFGEKG